MSQRYKLYRRISDIHVVCISVPQRFRPYAGQCEIHTSTGMTGPTTLAEEPS